MPDNFSSLLNYIIQNENHHGQTHNNHNKKKERERKIRKERKKNLDVYNYIYHYFPFMKHYFIETCFLLAT